MRLTPGRALWMLDKRLAQVATSLGVAASNATLNAMHHAACFQKANPALPSVA